MGLFRFPLKMHGSAHIGELGEGLTGKGADRIDADRVQRRL